MTMKISKPYINIYDKRMISVKNVNENLDKIKYDFKH